MKEWTPDALNEALRVLHTNPGNPGAVIADFESQAARRERQIERLQGEALALREIANGMRTLLGEAPQGNSGEEGATATPPRSSGMRPEGMEAVRRIMSDGGIWTAAQLLAEMKKRGWESRGSKNPIRPTEAAINRLWKVKMEIERVGRGQYRYIGLPT